MSREEIRQELIDIGIIDPDTGQLMPKYRQGPPDWSLDAILDLLDKYHQRATYSAVADLLATNPSDVAYKHPRDRRHSWVVNPGTGLPAGYTADQLHPQLQERKVILQRADHLQKWLREPS